MALNTLDIKKKKKKKHNLMINEGWILQDTYGI